MPAVKEFTGVLPISAIESQWENRTMEGLTEDMKFLAKEQKSIIPYLSVETKDEILLYKRLIAKHSIPLIEKIVL